MLKRKIKKEPSIDRYAAFTITDDGLSLVEIKRESPSRFGLSVCEHVPLDNPKVLPELMNERVEKYRLSDVPCSWVLQASQYQLLEIDNLDVPPAELKMAVRWRIKDLINFPHRDAAIDIIHIPKHGNSDHRKLLYVVVTRLPFLQEKMTMFKYLELNVQCIDIASLAYANILRATQSNFTNKALLCLLPDGAELLLSHENNIYLIYRLDFDSNTLDFTEPEVCEQLYHEVLRAYDYFANTMGFIEPIQLVLAPTAQDLTPLQQYLEQECHLLTVVGDIHDHLSVTTPQPIDRRLQALTYSALGGVLRFTRGEHAAGN